MITMFGRARNARRNQAKAAMIRSSKSLTEVTVTEAELAEAFARARKRKMTRRERDAQLVSFVWGNAPEGNQGTLETVRKNLHLSLLD